MREMRSPAQEAAEDIFFGQVVLIWARWFVILAGTILILWTATTTSEITVKILFIVGLMAMNFFLHGRYLMEQPANARLIALVTLIELGVFTMIILFWQGDRGLRNPLFVFYYPSLLAFALVFPPRLAIPYTVGSVAAYALACLVSDPGIVGQASDLKTLVLRLVTLAAVGGLATYYWRIQRARRRGALDPSSSTLKPQLSTAGQ